MFTVTISDPTSWRAQDAPEGISFKVSPPHPTSACQWEPMTSAALLHSSMRTWPVFISITEPVNSNSTLYCWPADCPCSPLEAGFKFVSMILAKCSCNHVALYQQYTILFRIKPRSFSKIGEDTGVVLFQLSSFCLTRLPPSLCTALAPLATVYALKSTHGNCHHDFLSI